ncbi:tetratricopeptide repeat protein [Vibrio sp. SS-MA-C1-2]|uniref:YfgM family protein n=1 Tax=Vibrio sp. SS-MA-C1-2 TaxID=2908646 RepID=UPI001F35F42A|nr:tetratricopeptide repeat protein [Vibrio sp. SS-MA-C1-2]UJF18956.1 tetratricopeptide repeat protein [Vibrio sp. SS-MA-C1-2]
MDVYSTEEQQVEAIKSWWQKNGKSVVIGTVVGLAALAGWRYYQAETLRANEQSSQAYHQVVTELTANSNDSIADAKAFIAEDNSSHYAVLTSLQLAKNYVENGDLAGAKQVLVDVQASNKDASLTPLILTRLARIYAEDENYTQANAELAKITDESWKGRVEELKGDFFARQGKSSEALQAYNQAQEFGVTGVIQMKIDDLAQ